MKYLGVDWGMNKIGLAYSGGEIASSWCVLNVQKNTLGKITAKLKAIVEKEKFDVIVLGKPEGKMGKVVENAKMHLEKAGMVVFLADETLATQEAQKLAIKMGIGKKKRRQDDAQSAAIILQRYLDEKSE